MTGNLLIEGTRSIILAGPADLLEEGKETAWAAPHVSVRPDFGWVLGRYVEADNANENGHIFGLDDLRATHQSVVNTPLNILHRAHQVVGTYTAAELLYPIEGAAEMEPQVLAAALETARAADPMQRPYVETLAAFWRYVFPDEYRAVQEAHATGSLFFSMEALPRALRCPDCPAEANEYAYAGIQSPTYCDHLNVFKAPKQLIEPRFVGGALVLPPAKPGWKRADVSEVADLIQRDQDQAERVYQQVSAAVPHLEPRQWEYMMAMLLAGALGPVPQRSLAEPVVARAVYNDQQRQAMAKTGEAMPDGTFPIRTTKDLTIALADYRWAPNKAAAKAHITKRAKAIGHEAMLPTTWTTPAATREPTQADTSDYSPAVRERLLKEGKALPGLKPGDPPRFPIDTVEDLRNAISSFGRHGGADATVKRFIIKRARALGHPELIPDGWSSSKATIA